MSHLKITVIAISLFCVSLAAQENSRSGAIRMQNSDSSVSGKKAVALSGRLSDDGKMLVSEDQDRWAIDNPSSVASQAGHSVTVKCQLAPDQNSIHVLLVKSAQPKYVATHSDSAFRR